MTPACVTVVLSCEHAGNEVPDEWAVLFSSRRAASALASHRAYDAGALALAQALVARVDAELVTSSVSRLLVDLNRSASNPRVFSEFSRVLPRDARRRLITELHAPHRARVARAVESASRDSALVLHIAVHSFVPSLRGAERDADIGLLYDPSRPRERALCVSWQRRLQAAREVLRVRRNYPYRGASDGLTTAFRRQFAARQYCGIELEVNQKLLRRDPAWLPELIAATLLGSAEELAADASMINASRSTS